MRTLLLDADIIAYKAAATTQEAYQFGDVEATAVHPDEMKTMCDEVISSYEDALNADSVVICLTDPNINFRKQLDPTYKMKRAATKKPLLLDDAKEYMAADYPSYIRPRLEADDVMGILATHPTLIYGEKVIVSEDKDMRTIPALVYSPNHTDVGIMDISELDANRFHMWQTICGDQTDGYPGCKGIGEKSEYAQEILFADQDELWGIVVDAYASKGKTEEDALLQARLAHILWHTSYNMKSKEIRLWEPFWLLNPPPKVIQ